MQTTSTAAPLTLGTVPATETAAHLLAGYGPQDHERSLTVVRDWYAADILTRDDGAIVLTWTDGVVNEWDATYTGPLALADAFAKLAGIERDAAEQRASVHR